MKTLSGSLILFILSTNAMAEIKGFTSNDNTGLNKLERIDTVEKYLSDLSVSLKKMESQLDENSAKLKNLDEVMKAFKAQQVAEAQKIVAPKLSEQKIDPPKDSAELEKMKADILVLKNEDIEKLKADFFELNETVKALKATLRDQASTSKRSAR